MRKRYYALIAGSMVVFLALYAFVARPLTQEVRWAESPAGNLLLALLFLVPFFVLAWSLTKLFGWMDRGDRSSL